MKLGAQALALVPAVCAEPSGALSRVSVDSVGRPAEAGESSYSGMSGDGRFVVFDSTAANLAPADVNSARDVFVHDRQTGETARVTSFPASARFQFCAAPSISGDGRLVLYYSSVDGLVPGDTNGVRDVFLHDRDTGRTARVSASANGAQANGASAVSPSVALSAAGDLVVFHSEATNLVAGDRNGVEDVYLHEVGARRTTRIGVSTSGVEPNGPSSIAAISPDGSTVSFMSAASNLALGDTNGALDVFVWVRKTQVVQCVSVSSTGEMGNGESRGTAALSADGRFVCFYSAATNLVPDDTNGTWDVFVHDRVLRTTVRASIATSGEQSDGASGDPAISWDGATVAFVSLASNLADERDANGLYDVYVRDLAAGTTERVSRASHGGETDGISTVPAISADGRSISFTSVAGNVVAGDASEGCADTFLFDRTLPRALAVRHEASRSPSSDAPIELVWSGTPRCTGFDAFRITVLRARAGVLVWELGASANGTFDDGGFVRSPFRRADGGAITFPFTQADIAAAGLAPGTTLYARCVSHDGRVAAPIDRWFTGGLQFTIAP